ncbi:MAG: S46 family peptidase [Burkholderiales bacterium]
MKCFFCRFVLLGLFAVSIMPGWALAHEGMWTFDNPPLAQLKERYGFTPTQDWLDHIRLSSVRYSHGGSGSFVSANGLSVTNHHVARSCIQKISTEAKDYVKNGFSARTQTEEIACPDLELNVLASFEDVTKRVLGAVSAGANDKDAREARKAVIAQIEKQCDESTKLRCDVVTLYQDSEYWLYRYKKYTDVRLVFAPEQSIAFFGGDPDNFVFPRYDLDVSFFRAYENGKPAQTSHYLKWSATGAQENDLALVSGHPGGSSRLLTLAQLVSERDVQTPLMLSFLNRGIRMLKKYSATSPEATRRAANWLFSYENSLKVQTGQYAALNNAKVMAKKEAEEKSFRVAAKNSAEIGDPWQSIEDAMKKRDANARALFVAENFGSKLAYIARTIVELTAEMQKPNEKRLEEYRESQLESLHFRLFSGAPIYKDLETAILQQQVADALETLQPDHPLTSVLRAVKPADEIVAGTKLDNPEERKRLVAGGVTAVMESTDPMIVLARSMDQPFREMRKLSDDEIKAVTSASGEKIGKARFKLKGKSVSPDATFSLRLAYGQVKGYPAHQTKMPWKTTFYGLYERAAAFDNNAPFDLPNSWQEKRTSLDLTTPFNFVLTNDIIGGNSGSPVVNKAGEVIGLIFDGNIESMGSDYFFDEETGRAIAVHTRAITEALEKVYAMPTLAAELKSN